MAPWLEPAAEGGDVDEADGGDEDGSGAGLADVVPLRRPDEFLCQACFLLKHTSQLVDPARKLCRDCA
jgi:hypothetical protein